MKILAVRGTNYECGFQIGKTLKNQINSRLKIFKISNKEVINAKNKLQRIHNLCSKNCPQLIDELKGIAEGSNVDYWKLLLLNCPEVYYGIEGCSTIAINNKEKTMLFHNEDGVNIEQKRFMRLVKYIKKDITFHAFVYAGGLPGWAYSWNSKGLFISVNYLRPVKINLNNFPRSFICRALIESKSINDAIRILRGMNNASSAHWFIGKKNKIISVEQLQNELSIIHVKGIYPHTNHYLHPKFMKYTRSWGSSKLRLKRVCELINKKSDVLEILFDTKNRPNCIFGREKDDLKTLSTFVVNSKENIVKIYNSNSKKHFIKFKLS